MTVEKWLLAEDHAGKHTAKAPHIQRVVIHLSTEHTDNNSDSPDTKHL